ncbi:MAG: zf-HC2 domain-containing protein [Pseudomonadales bacterium]|nr:zf-HC2 domain-containing protein [Pseudomonadales bacterium]
MNRKKHHEHTLEVLPWFVNDTLDRKEREQVLKHLAQCDGCREERDRLIELQKMIREGEVVDGDVEFSFRRTMKRIEEAERNRESVADLRDRNSKRRLFASLALAAGLGVFLVGTLLVGDTGQGTEFQTLTSDQPGVPGSARQMAIGFVDPIPATTLRQALIETGSNIVSGPDENGVYLVEVEVPGGLSHEVFLRRIQGIEGVKHAAFAQ